MAQQSIAQIVTENRRVRIVYLDPQGNITERVVDIDRVYTHDGTHNALVVGFCHRRGATRTFSMAGILAAMPDDSTTVATFSMTDAVSRHDADAFHTAYERFHAVA